MSPEHYTPDTDKKNKHPERLIIDHTKPQDMVLLDNSGSRSLWASNTRGDYQQGDTYVEGQQSTPADRISVNVSNVNGAKVSKTTHELNYTTLIAAQDVSRRETYEMGNVYFETAKTDLATADSTDKLKKSNINDASGYIAKKAEEIVGLLSTKGNEKLEIAVIGHASKTGDHDENQALSDNRAKVVSAELIADVNRLDPTGKLAARIHQTTEGTGDNQLAVQTTDELKKNRNVSIEVVTQNVATPDRTYQVVHLDKTDVESIQRIGDGAFTLDLNGSSTAGKSLKEKFALQIPVPARGAVLLETTDYAKPLDIKVTALEAGDFRLLVADKKQKVTYQVNDDHTVSVKANDKPIAVLHYSAQDGPVKAEDVHVGTMDANGLTTAATRDLAAESRSAEEKSNATLMNLLKAMDTDHDGKIDQAKVDAYAKNAILREKLGAADLDGNGRVDFQEVRTMGERLRNGMEGAAFQNATADVDFANAVRQIGHQIAGNPEANKEELAAARSMDAEFRYLLDKGGFEKLKNGPLAFADLAKSLEDVATQQHVGQGQATRDKDNLPPH